MPTLPNGIKLTYGYDNANELTGLTYKLGTTTVGTLTYGFDRDGRINTRGGTLDVTNLPAALASASYDANNRLTNWGGTTLSYDADGNLTGDGTNTYAWNTRNQLTNISGGTTASFGYDALGRRESKTISGTATNFLYDGLNMEQELNGTTPTVNYLTGANIDETFSRADSTGTYSYLTDNLGSTLSLTNSSGAISTSYAYEPYGNTTASGNTSSNSLQYTGRENDGDGLYYYRARYYSPAYSRFISEDPIGFIGGLDTYTYVADNPLSWSDPLGLCPQHNYQITEFTLCSAAEAFSVLEEPDMTAPGAPQAHEGYNPYILLWGNNPISQNVNSSTMTIVNTTLPGHVFYPGNVTWQVTPGPLGFGSIINVTGTGTGSDPLENDLVGLSYFGGVASEIAMICALQGAIP